MKEDLAWESLEGKAETEESEAVEAEEAEEAGEDGTETAKAGTEAETQMMRK